MFDWLTDLLTKIVDTIKRVIEEIVDALGPFLPLLLIAAFVFAGPISAYLGTSSFWGGVFETVSAWGFWTQLAVGVGVSAVVLPEETSELVSTVAETAGEIAAEVGEIVGSVAGSVVDGVVSSGGFSSLLLWGAVGIGAYLLLTSDDGNNNHNSTNYDTYSNGNVITDGEGMVL